MEQPALPELPGLRATRGRRELTALMEPPVQQDLPEITEQQAQQVPEEAQQDQQVIMEITVPPDLLVRRAVMAPMELQVLPARMETMAQQE